MDPLIINLCPTGMIPTKEMTPHVPITPEEIINTVVECEDIISVVHIHPRDEYGKPTWKKEIFAKIISGIREKTSKILISVTTSGRLWNDFERRSEVLELTGDLKPDLASLTVGSMNFINQESVNSPKMIEDLARKMMGKGIKPEFEIFEPGMLHKARHLLYKGIVADDHPYFNILLGSLGTSPLEPSVFSSFISNLPNGAIWSLAGIGQYQFPVNILALLFGGHIRVGLEDNIFLDYYRKILGTNDSLVTRILSNAKHFNRVIATPSETKEILGLK